jgi:hypothetical protein
MPRCPRKNQCERRGRKHSQRAPTRQTAHRAHTDCVLRILHRKPMSDRVHVQRAASCETLCGRHARHVRNKYSRSFQLRGPCVNNVSSGASITRELYTRRHCSRTFVQLCGITKGLVAHAPYRGGSLFSLTGRFLFLFFDSFNGLLKLCETEAARAVWERGTC